MKFLKTVFVIFFLFAVSFFPGCGGEKRPQGFPKIYKCQLKVVENGTPVSDVIVKLESSDREANKWSPSGSTGEDGIADLQTRGFPGAPVAEYKVLLEKYGVPMTEISPGVYQSNDPSNQIAEEYGNPDTTPFTLTVSKKQETIPTFDIGDGSTK